MNTSLLTCGTAIFWSYKKTIVRHAELVMSDYMSVLHCMVPVHAWLDSRVRGGFYILTSLLFLKRLLLRYF